MNYLKLSFLFLAITLFVSCKQKGKEQKKDNSPVSVDVMIAHEEDFTSSIEVNGTVLSEDMIELRSEVSGRITYLNIPDGAKVTKGSLLVKINDADLQAQLEQQKVRLDLAVKTEQRLKSLLNANGIDQATYDAALNEVHLLEANIKVLHAQIDKTIIKAPFTGRLGLRLVSVGAYVSPSTLIGTLQQTDRIMIDFTIPETYEQIVKVGNSVMVETVGSVEKLTAEINAIEPQINTLTRNLKVRARLKTGNLRPGSFVKVYLISEKKGILVPSSSIIPDAFSNMVVLVKNNKAKFVNVETGIRTADAVEITTGLEIGDSIVVAGVLYVRPNRDVRVEGIVKSKK